MPTLESFSVVDLLLDPENARLSNVQANQQEAILALAELNPDHFVNLAQDISERGTLDPLTIPAVIPMPGQEKKYLVVEGNRRIAALKALETPDLVTPVLNAAQKRRLTKSSSRYAKNPIPEVMCQLFADIQAAEPWVTNRHTGQNRGVGLVNWGSAEQDNWDARHGRRSHFRQMMDFAGRFSQLPPEVSESPTKIKTNLERLVKTVKEEIGLVRRGGVTYTNFPPQEAARPLGHLITILKTGEIDVNDLRSEDDRAKIGTGIPNSLLPSHSKRLAAPVPLDDFTFDRATPEQLTRAKTVPKEGVEEPGDDSKPKKARRKTRRRKQLSARSSLVPPSCHFDIDLPRLNNIYVELARISHNDFPEAVSVLLRVFLELSTDYYIDLRDLLPEDSGQRQKAILAKKLKLTAAELRRRKKINPDLHTAIQRMADSDRYVQASVVAFHQYVHNRHKPAVASELETIWDVTLEPFLQAIFSD